MNLNLGCIIVLYGLWTDLLHDWAAKLLIARIPYCNRPKSQRHREDEAK